MIAIALAGTLACGPAQPLYVKERTRATVTYALPRNPYDRGEESYGSVHAARVDGNGTLWLLFMYGRQIGMVRGGRLTLCVASAQRARWIDAALRSPRYGSWGPKHGTLSLPYGRDGQRVVVRFASYAARSPVWLEPGHRLIGFVPPGSVTTLGYEAPNGDVWFSFDFSGKNGNIANTGTIARVGAGGAYRVFRIGTDPDDVHGTFVSDVHGLIWVYNEYCECLWRIDPTKLH